MTLQLPEILDAQLERRRGPKGRQLSNNASQLGHPCLRYLCYCRLRGDERKPIEIDLRRIFDLGNFYEDYVIRRLLGAGIRVLGAQKMGHWPAYNIRGHIDGYIALGDLATAAKELGFGSAIEGIGADSDEGYWRQLADGSPEAFDKSVITQKWWAQCLLYCLLEEIGTCWLLLIRKATGEMRQITIRLDDHLDEAEALVKKAEEIERVIAAGGEPLPDQINDVDVCRGCDFEHICCPAISYGPGVEIIEDDHDLLNDLYAYEQLAEAKQDFDRVYRRVKERFELPAGCDKAEWLVINTGWEDTFQITARRDSRGAVRKTIRRIEEEE